MRVGRAGEGVEEVRIGGVVLEVAAAQAFLSRNQSLNTRNFWGSRRRLG